MKSPRWHLLLKQLPTQAFLCQWQVVVGSFFPDYRRDTNVGNQTEPSSAPSKLHAGYGPTGAGSPPSRGTLSESSGGGPGSPLNQSAGGGAAVNSTPQGMSSLPWK